MEAVSLDGRTIEKIELADHLVKKIFKNAVYMTQYDNYTLVLFPTSLKIEEVEKGLEYTFYLVNNVLFNSSLTSSHEHLIKVFGSKSIDEQLSLF